jgi:hypothetical protein
MSSFTTYKTISGREIKVRPNYSKRHFTIKTDAATYRTYKMNQDEFDSNEFNTGNDWQQFLRSDDYYKVR